MRPEARPTNLQMAAARSYGKKKMDSYFPKEL